MHCCRTRRRRLVWLHTLGVTARHALYTQVGLGQCWQLKAEWDYIKVSGVLSLEAKLKGA